MAPGGGTVLNVGVHDFPQYPLLVTLYRDRFNAQGPVARFLTRNAFGVYVFHAPILIAATQILRLWPTDAAIKFLAASALGLVLTFSFVGFVARRTPGLRAII